MAEAVVRPVESRMARRADDGRTTSPTRRGRMTTRLGVRLRGLVPPTAMAEPSGAVHRGAGL